MNVLFDSKLELEFAMNIYYQFNQKLEYRKNVHVLCNNIEIDFIIENTKTILEIHPDIFFRDERFSEYKRNRYNNILKSKLKNAKSLTITGYPCTNRRY